MYSVSWLCWIIPTQHLQEATFWSPFTKITLPQERSLKQSNQTRIPPELQQSSYQTQTKKIQKKTRPQTTCILASAKKRSKSTIHNNHVPRSNSQYFMKFEELTTSGRISFLVPSVNAMRLIVTSNRESRIKNRRKRLLMINNFHTKLLFYLQRLHQHILSKFNHNLRGRVFFLMVNVGKSLEFIVYILECW